MDGEHAGCWKANITKSHDCYTSLPGRLHEQSIHTEQGWGHLRARAALKGENLTHSRFDCRVHEILVRAKIPGELAFLRC